MNIIKEEFLYNLDLNDPFFDSLKKDYYNFEKWFKTKANQNKKAFLTYNNNNSITSLLILKLEDQNEDYSDFEKKLDKKRRLKISTFKVSNEEKNIAKEFINLILKQAIKYDIDQIYFTVFNDKIDLIKFMEKHGFKFFCFKKTKKQNGNTETEKVMLLNLKKTIVLPIKPEYVEKIFNKTKKYEFRKISPKKEINKIIIYSTFPVKKIVGEVEILEIIKNTPEKIWEVTKEFSGISKQEFFNYYYNKKTSIAYKLGSIKIYKTPKDLKEIGVNYTPQSYLYLD